MDSKPAVTRFSPDCNQQPPVRLGLRGKFCMILCKGKHHVRAGNTQRINNFRPVIKGWHDGNLPDFNEKETRQRIIAHILTALGWSTINSFHTMPEYFVNEETGYRIDYAMFTD